MSTKLQDLERLFEPQFSLAVVNNGILTYFWWEDVNQPELRHTTRWELPELAKAVRVINPPFRPNSVLPMLAPATSTGEEPVPADNPYGATVV